MKKLIALSFFLIFTSCKSTHSSDVKDTLLKVGAVTYFRIQSKLVDKYKTTDECLNSGRVSKKFIPYYPPKNNTPPISIGISGCFDFVLQQLVYVDGKWRISLEKDIGIFHLQHSSERFYCGNRPGLFADRNFKNDYKKCVAKHQALIDAGVGYLMQQALSDEIIITERLDKRVLEHKATLIQESDYYGSWSEKARSVLYRNYEDKLPYSYQTLLDIAFSSLIHDGGALDDDERLDSLKKQVKTLLNNKIAVQFSLTPARSQTEVLNLLDTCYEKLELNQQQKSGFGVASDKSLVCLEFACSKEASTKSIRFLNVCRPTALEVGSAAILLPAFIWLPEGRDVLYQLYLGKYLSPNVTSANVFEYANKLGLNVN